MTRRKLKKGRGSKGLIKPVIWLYDDLVRKALCYLLGSQDIVSSRLVCKQWKRCIDDMVGLDGVWVDLSMAPKSKSKFAKLLKTFGPKIRDLDLSRGVDKGRIQAAVGHCVNIKRMLWMGDDLPKKLEDLPHGLFTGKFFGFEVLELGNRFRGQVGKTLKSALLLPGCNVQDLKFWGTSDGGSWTAEIIEKLDLKVFLHQWHRGIMNPSVKMIQSLKAKVNMRELYLEGCRIERNQEFVDALTAMSPSLKILVLASIEFHNGIQKLDEGLSLDALSSLALIKCKGWSVNMSKVFGIAPSLEAFCVAGSCTLQENPFEQVEIVDGQAPLGNLKLCYIQGQSWCTAKALLDISLRCPRLSHFCASSCRELSRSLRNSLNNLLNRHDRYPELTSFDCSTVNTDMIKALRKVYKIHADPKYPRLFQEAIEEK